MAFGNDDAAPAANGTGTAAQNTPTDDDTPWPVRRPGTRPRADKEQPRDAPYDRADFARLIPM